MEFYSMGETWERQVLSTVFIFIEQWLLQKAFCNTVLLVVDNDGEIAH